MIDYQKITEFHKLSMDILSLANTQIPRIDFFYLILKKIKNYLKCDRIELRYSENNGFFVYEISESNKFKKTIIGASRKKSIPKLKNDSFLDIIRQNLFEGKIDIAKPFLSSNSSFWYSGLNNINQEIKKLKGKLYNQENIDLHYESLALIPINIQNKVIGLLQITSNIKKYLDLKKIKLLEGIAHTLSIAIINKRAQGALRERIKELSCLYEISKIAEKEDLSLDELLFQIVDLIPAAWQYPEITEGEINLDGKKYSTKENTNEQSSQYSDIIIKGVKRGRIKTIYTEHKSVLDEGPFLKEERNLINAIAKQVGLIVERREAEEEKSNLQEQIRHADRLATIGQLAAGVAHELNEPLGNILGFAQLSKKYPHLPDQVVSDIDKIINASLHAREIIKKLMLFSRQMPHKSEMINLNNMVVEGLYFFEARCIKAGINLVKKLDKNIPEIEGDAAQLNQVLVNLVVNSIHAMPNGGDLEIRTTYDQENVFLIIEDNGIGIKEEVKSKIFIPFFTTKDIDEGTGLGLAVAHGIVVSHKGSIKFESEEDKGTRFEIKFPVI